MKKKKNRFSLSSRAVTGMVICLALLTQIRPSDSYIINRVVQLKGSRGSCSGEQVRAPSGQDYILTAGHCDVLMERGSISVVMEDGRTLQRRVIAEDPASDLLLIEGLPNLKGLEIAKDLHKFQAVRTFTHGLALSTHESEGNVIEDITVNAAISAVSSQEEISACISQAKHSILEVWGQYLCMLSVKETITTALVHPGSSGGPAVDSRGRLVGVVSVSMAEQFSGLVRLKDIQAFMAAY